MAVEQSLKLNIFEIESNFLTGNSGENTDNTEERNQLVDLRSGAPLIEYRESIFSPFVEVTAYLVDTGNTVQSEDGSDSAIGLLEAGYCQGTEKVFFQIEDSNGIKINLANQDGEDLRLASVTSTRQGFQNQTFIITAVSKEAFDNTLLDNRCTMQYSGRISDIVSGILQHDLKSAKWGGTYFDETMNEYHEWGNGRYPFEMLLDLQQLAIPIIQTEDADSALGKTAGYLFWQTSERYHFRSLDKLFDVTDKRIKRYIENKKAEPNLPEGFQGKILWSTSTRSIDALAQFESGARGGRLYVYNPLKESEEQCYVKDLSAKDSGNGIIAGKLLPRINDEYRDENGDPVLTMRLTSRAAVGQTVKGNETIEMQVEKTGDPNYEVQNIFLQATQNYRQKMSVSIQITIAADFSLHAGDLIYCEFEEMTTSKTVRGSRFRDSGIYMIADLCHYGDVTKSFTGLHLVRDSFGVKVTEEVQAFIDDTGRSLADAAILTSGGSIETVIE
tara:strand:- start:2741 stop:4246 length:1506 start_codon:yes stop_codon:yes gene_type:complete